MSEEEENCKDCGWLTETWFKHRVNGKDLYYCNNLKYRGEMEMTDEEFVKCDFYDPTRRFGK